MNMEVPMENKGKKEEKSKEDINILIGLVSLSLMLLAILFLWLACSSFWKSPRTYVIEICDQMKSFDAMKTLLYEEKDEKNDSKAEIEEMTEASFTEIYNSIIGKELIQELCENNKYITYRINDVERLSDKEAKVTVTLTYRALPYDEAVESLKNNFLGKTDEWWYSYDNYESCAYHASKNWASMLKNEYGCYSIEKKTTKITFCLKKDGFFSAWELEKCTHEKGMPSLENVIFAEAPMVYDEALKEAKQYWSENPPEEIDESEENQETDSSDEEKESVSRLPEDGVSGVRLFEGEDDSSSSSSKKHSSSKEGEEYDNEPDPWSDGFEEYYDTNKNYYSNEEDAYDDYLDDEDEWEEE